MNENILPTMTDEERNEFLEIINTDVEKPMSLLDGFEDCLLYYMEDEDGNPLPVATKLDVSLLASFRLAGRTVMVSHGHRYMVDMGTEVLHSVAENIDADLAFFGHTHRPHREEIGATLILNPGSCSQPRGGNPPTIAVVSFPGSTERYHTEFFEIKKTLFGGWDFSIFH